MDNSSRSTSRTTTPARPAGSRWPSARAKANAGTEFGGPLTRVAGEIDEDRDALKRIMARLDVSPAPVKAGLAWAAEKAGRVKPNGQIRGYSPLGRMVELEALVTGVSGKLSLWRALQQVAPGEPRLDAAQLAELAGARRTSSRACTSCATAPRWSPSSSA